jgi:hypothetical protein
MKTISTIPQGRTRMNIEIFDVQLLKETRLFSDEDNAFEYDAYNETWIEEETDIPELSLDAFKYLLEQ